VRGGDMTRSCRVCHLRSFGEPTSLALVDRFDPLEHFSFSFSRSLGEICVSRETRNHCRSLADDLVPFSRPGAFSEGSRESSRESGPRWQTGAHDDIFSIFPAVTLARARARLFLPRAHRFTVKMTHAIDAGAFVGAFYRDDVIGGGFSRWFKRTDRKSAESEMRLALYVNRRIACRE